MSLCYWFCNLRYVVLMMYPWWWLLPFKCLSWRCDVVIWLSVHLMLMCDTAGTTTSYHTTVSSSVRRYIIQVLDSRRWYAAYVLAAFSSARPHRAQVRVMACGVVWRPSMLDRTEALHSAHPHCTQVLGMTCRLCDVTRCLTAPWRVHQATSGVSHSWFHCWAVWCPAFSQYPAGIAARRAVKNWTTSMSANVRVLSFFP